MTLYIRLIEVTTITLIYDIIENSLYNEYINHALKMDIILQKSFNIHYGDKSDKEEDVEKR